MLKNVYLSEQLTEVEVIARLIDSVPVEKRAVAIMMLSSFVSGMEIQENFEKEAN